MIEINETVTLPATADEVWAVLSDPHEVVGLLADAQITKENEDGTFDGVMTIKFGPMRVKFMARVGLELNEIERLGNITARGKDTQGGTRMTTTANFEVLATGDVESTVVNLRGKTELSGRLATQIESAAGVVVKRMSTEFTEALTARLSPTPEIEVAGPKAGIIGRIVAWFKRLFRRK
jgi:carbon monoxide dehydrogenase subunit G